MVSGLFFIVIEFKEFREISTETQFLVKRG